MLPLEASETINDEIKTCTTHNTQHTTHINNNNDDDNDDNSTSTMTTTTRTCLLYVVVFPSMFHVAARVRVRVRVRAIGQHQACILGAYQDAPSIATALSAARAAMQVAMQRVKHAYY